MSYKRNAVFILSLGLLAISFGSIFVKLCEAPALIIAFYRLAISSLFYIGFTKVAKGSIYIGFTKPQKKMIVLSALFLTIHFATWISSLKLTSVASSVILVQSAPVFVVIGSVLFLKEKPTLLMILGILITLTGGIIVAAYDFSVDQSSLAGNLLAVCGAIGAAGYMLIGRRLRANIDIFRYVTSVYSLTAIFLFIITLFDNAPYVGYDLKVYLLFAAMAFIPQVIGHTSFNWALKYFSAITVSIVILGEPIGASILAMLILGETLTFVKIMGCFVIIVGVVIALFAEMNNSKS